MTPNPLPVIQGVAPAMHGGADALGLARWDFSTNSNACGPCPSALRAVQQADACHYPDPRYTALRAALAHWHGVAPWQVLLGGGASELIHRIHVWARLHGLAAGVVPVPAYGDYAQQAAALGLRVQQRPVIAEKGVTASSGQPAIEWVCEPSSPLGTVDRRLDAWPHTSEPPPARRFLDAAYAPLVLADEDMAWLERARERARRGLCWQLFSPNKSLGLTGVRAAYAIAPCLQGADDTRALQAMLSELEALAPSWPVGAHGVAMLQAWMRADVQDWLAHSRTRLQQWKQAQMALCESLGWWVVPGSIANYFVAQPFSDGAGDAMAQALHRLRGDGIKLRDTASMGLPMHVRLGVQPPAAQMALADAWRRLPSSLSNPVELNPHGAIRR